MATMIAADIITPARKALSDTDSDNYRWSDADLNDNWLAAGARLIWDFAKQSRFNTSGVYQTAFSFTDTTAGVLPAGNMQLDDYWKFALMDYVCFRAFAQDATDQHNVERSEFHRASFNNFLGGPAA